MASPIAPVLQTEIAIEQAPDPINIGGLFSGFGRAMAPKTSAAPSADREFADTVQAALAVADDTEKGGPSKARSIMQSAVLRLASFGEVTEEQAAIASQFGIDVNAFLGIDPEKQARDEFFSGVEGQTYLRMARLQLADAGVKDVTEDQIADYAFTLKINNEAVSTQLAAENARLDLGLVVKADVVQESIAQDMDILTAAYQTALEDGIVTEAERATLNMQFQQFAGVKYGAYRGKVPGVAETLDAMQGLVSFLGTQAFDETENTLDQYRIFMKDKGMSPVAIEAFTMAVKKGNLTDLGASLTEMYDAAQGLGMLDTSVKFDTFATTEEIDKAVTDAVTPPTDSTSAAQQEKYQQEFIRGTLKLNSGDIDLSDTSNRASFFNQTMGMLGVIAEQDAALLGRVERGMLTDPNFETNMTKFMQFEPDRGAVMFERYVQALRSDLTNMDNQIAGSLGDRFNNVLLVDPKTSKFSIDFDRLREIYAGEQVVGVSMADIIDQIEEKVKQAGGIDSYLKMSHSRQQVKVGDAGFMFTLTSILGNPRNVKTIFNLSPERAKLSAALERAVGKAGSVGVDVEALAQAAIDKTPADGTVQGERMVPEMQGTELGKLGSEAAPYTFEDWSDEKTYNWFLNEAPMGTYVRIDNGDGSVNTFVVGSEGRRVVLKDPATGVTVAKLRERGS